MPPESNKPVVMHREYQQGLVPVQALIDSTFNVASYLTHMFSEGWELVGIYPMLGTVLILHVKDSVSVGEEVINA